MPPPNSLKNLIPYPPGVSGNSDSNGYSLTSELKHALNKEKRLAIVNSTIEGAILREPTPFRELWDRVEGKLQDKERLPLTDIKILIVYEGDRKPELVEGEPDAL